MFSPPPFTGSIKGPLCRPVQALSLPNIRHSRAPLFYLKLSCVVRGQQDLKCPRDNLSIYLQCQINIYFDNLCRLIHIIFCLCFIFYILFVYHICFPTLLFPLSFVFFFLCAFLSFFYSFLYFCSSFFVPFHLSVSLSFISSLVSSLSLPLSLFLFAHCIFSDILLITVETSL